MIVRIIVPRKSNQTLRSIVLNISISSPIEGNGELIENYYCYLKDL